MDKLLVINPICVYFVVDGPRNKDESTEVQIVRDYVKSLKFYDANKTIFREKNYGINKSISEGLDWFFSTNPLGIILEDDCVPSLDFFYYVENCLSYFKDDEACSMISGINLFPDLHNPVYDMGRIRFPQHWGWATWKEKWVESRNSTALVSKLFNFFKYTFFSKGIRLIDKTKLILLLISNSRNINPSWDENFLVFMISEGKFSVYPKVNLIDYLGNDVLANSVHLDLPVIKSKRQTFFSPGLIYPSNEVPLFNFDIERCLIKDFYRFPNATQVLRRLKAGS
jgi:hypothetical protein